MVSRSKEKGVKKKAPKVWQRLQEASFKWATIQGVPWWPTHQSSQTASYNIRRNKSSVAEVLRVINEQTHCEVHNWLITRVLVDNGGISGVAANLTVWEFKEAVFYPSTEEDLAWWRMLVEKHKTAENYGAAVVWVYDDL